MDLRFQAKGDVSWHSLHCQPAALPTISSLRMGFETGSLRRTRYLHATAGLYSEVVLLKAGLRRSERSRSSSMLRLSFLTVLLLVFLSADFEVCLARPADQGYISLQRIYKAIRTLNEYYGDVRASVNCTIDRYPAAAIICRDKYLYAIATLNSMTCVLSIENATGDRLDDHKYYHTRYINPDECDSTKKREQCLPPCVTKMGPKMRYGLIPPITCITKKCIYEFYMKQINDAGGDVSPFSDPGQDLPKPAP